MAKAEPHHASNIRPLRRLSLLSSKVPPNVSGNVITSSNVGGGMPFLHRGSLNGGNNSQPQPQQPQRVLTKNNDSFRSTFRRRMSGSGQPKNTLQQQQQFGGSFRRLSLDQQLACQAQGQDLDKSDGSDKASSIAVAKFQEVFQKMKQENPSASMGALRHKTMTRIAELKIIHQEEEHLEREERERKEEEERLRNQNLAKKYVGKLVDKITRPSMVAYQQGHSLLQEHHHLHHNFSSVNNTHQHSNNSNGHHSPHDSQSGGDDNNEDNDDHIFLQHMPISERASMIIRKQVSNRRVSVDSGDTLNLNHSNEAKIDNSRNTLYINAGLVGGDDQAGNFAPRKSVGDLIAFGNDFLGSEDDESDNKSAMSFLTNVSGLFMDSDSALDIEIKDDDDDANVILGLSKDISGLKISKSKQNFLLSHLHQQGQMGTKVLVESAPLPPPPSSPYNMCCPKEESTSVLCGAKDLCDVLSTARSAMSGASEFTEGDYSMAGSKNGLIVGFVNRSKDEEDGLIVGFGDRSKKDKKEKDDDAW